MWSARAGFPPGTRAQKNALLAPNHAQRLGAFLCLQPTRRDESKLAVTPQERKLVVNKEAPHGGAGLPGFRMGDSK